MQSAATKEGAEISALQPFAAYQIYDKVCSSYGPYYFQAAQ